MIIHDEGSTHRSSCDCQNGTIYTHDPAPAGALCFGGSGNGRCLKILHQRLTLPRPVTHPSDATHHGSRDGTSILSLVCSDKPLGGLVRC